MSSRSARIAVIHPDLGLGGAERLIVDAALGLQDAGHEVTLFTARHDAERCFPETVDGRLRVRVEPGTLPRHLGQRLRAPLAVLRMHHLARVVARCQPAFDLLFVDVVAHVLPWLRRKLPSTPQLFYCHFPDQLLSPPGKGWHRHYRNALAALENRGLLCADRVLVNSAFTGGRLRAVCPALPEERIQVLSPGVEVPPLQTGGDPEPREGFRILSVGRFSPDKNLTLAVQALDALRTELGPDHFAHCQLTIAGGCDIGDASNADVVAKLRELTSKLGLDAQTRLILSPSPAELDREFYACDCLLHPTLGEHFGIAPVEAMVRGKPVVACRGGGPDETVQDGAGGLICEPRPEALAAAVGRLARDPELRTRMGAAARERGATYSRERFNALLCQQVAELLA